MERNGCGVDGNCYAGHASRAIHRVLRAERKAIRGGAGECESENQELTRHPCARLEPEIRRVRCDEFQGPDTPLALARQTPTRV